MTNEDMLSTIFGDLQECLDDRQEVHNVEEARLRLSTDPSEHLCDSNCPHLYSIESQRETVHRVCPISNLTWGSDTKWDLVLASKSAQIDERQHSLFKRRPNCIIAPTEQYSLSSTATLDQTERTENTNLLDNVEHVEQVEPVDSCEPSSSTPRNTPRSTRENNLLEAHFALRSIAEQIIYNPLHQMKIQAHSVSQIHQELITASEHDRSRHMRPFTLTQLNDIQIESHRLAMQSKQRLLLHQHVVNKHVRVEQFVNILAQLFSTLWIITAQNQIKRREIDSFKSFVKSLLNCIHRGMRISNQPILPRGILFFHETKRKHRFDSAHHALQQVQNVLGTLNPNSKTELFQQCIRLSRQLEVIHQELIGDDLSI